MTLLGSSISEAHSLSQVAKLKIAVASSVTVLVVLSILFFIIGFLCGRFGRKEKKKQTSLLNLIQNIHSLRLRTVMN